MMQKMLNMAGMAPGEVLAVIKPDVRLLRVGRDNPGGNGCYRHVNVLVERDNAHDPYVVWELVIPDDAAPFCHTGYYARTREGAELELARRR